MSKLLYDRIADLLVNYSLAVKPGDLICLQGSDNTVPIMGALARAVLAAGGQPYTDIIVDEVVEAMHEAPSIDQTSFVNPFPVDQMKKIAGIIKLHGVHNTRYLSSQPIERIQAYTKGQSVMRTEYFQRINNGSLKWCVTAFPCNSLAQDSNLSLLELEEMMYSACLLDKSDPIAAWKEFRKEQERLAAILNTKKTIRVTAPGTDLTLGVGGRRWVSCHGANNMPDGEVFTSPLENATNGQITYSYPAINNGREVQNVVLTFKDGICTEAHASKDEAFLISMLNTDPGARILGELAFGTNAGVTTFTKNILFDEKIAGTIHCALGNSYAEAGGTNHSVIHWDMICDMRNEGRAYADGELIYENGKFLI